jgi:hypothetical protein
MMALEGSVTVPWSVAVDWARAIDENAASIRLMRIGYLMLILAFLSIERSLWMASNAIQ